MRSRPAIVAHLVATLASSGCSSSDPPASPRQEAPACGESIPPYDRGSATTITFPPGFLLGAASAGMQIEKGLVHADWWHWAKLPGKVAGGDHPDDGPDALAHVEADVAALKEAGAKAYRFSIEWSRIYPTRAAFDANEPDREGLAAYHDLLDRLRAAGIRPFVTLHHFATPDWLVDVTKPREPQGFERDEMAPLFAEWAARMGKEFGAKVDDWVTINEPLVLMVGAYLVGAHPPGPPLDMERMFAAAKKLVRAHVAAYRALKAADQIDAGTGRASAISIAKHQRVFYPQDPCEEADVVAAKKTNYLWNDWIFEALVRGNWDDDADGTYDGPNDRKADPTLAGTLDWIGINFYGLGSINGALKLAYIGGLPRYEDIDPDLPKTDMNWDVFPHGLRFVLRDAKKYGLPIVVTESGVADGTDRNKSRYLAEHLWEVGRAIAEEGVDVRGYLWWSLTDNFEWDRGYCPRFGLYRVDYASPQKTRTKTAAVDLFRAIADRGSLDAAAVDALPPYQDPTICPGPR
jgi:beta-glucosidase